MGARRVVSVPSLQNKYVLVIAVMAALLFAALNQTIIGTLAPRIATELGGSRQLTWLFTLFMLTSTVATALIGSFSDRYGRKPFLLIGLFLLITGTFLCGLSASMQQLIGSRGIQGFGVGILISMAFTVIGDFFEPHERGRWLGLMTSVYGLASLFSPTLGGYLVDHANWRWAYWSFLPIGILAFVAIGFLYPRETKRREKPLDILGSLWLTTAIISLLLSVNLAGSRFAWSSPTTLVLLLLTLLAAGLFIRTQRRAQDPVIPLSLFKNRSFTLSALAGFASSIAMFGTLTYVPLFLQGVTMTSASIAGYVVMATTLSLVTANALAGWLLAKPGRARWLAVAGLAAMTAGQMLLSVMDAETGVVEIIACLMVFGLGLGTTLSVFALTVQNAVARSRLGAATAVYQLFRQLGATVGLAVMGVMMSMRMGGHALEGEALLQNPDILGYALSGTFRLGAYAVAAALLFTCFLRDNIIISTEGKSENDQGAVHYGKSEG